jgi:hypothetical protein
VKFFLTFYLIDHRLIALAIVAVLLAAGEIGYRVGTYAKEAPEAHRSLMSGIGAATLGLLGLLLAFTLSMAIARWDERRDVIVDEANAIGTLWLRAGLIEEPLRRELRGVLREYGEVRITLSGSRENSDDLDVLRAAVSTSESLHAKIWSVVERADKPGLSTAKLSTLIVSANELIDIHELRLASLENYLPAPIFFLLTGVAAIAVAFLAWSFGATSQRGRGALLLLILLISVVLLLIMDINRPQRGRIEVGFAPLERVRDSMNKPVP